MGTGPCTFTLTADTFVVAGFGPVRSLKVTTTGSGSGTVLSYPPGVECGTTCSAQFNDGTSVALTADPAAGSRFAGWSGDCSGTVAQDCSFWMTANRSVTASFEKLPPRKCIVPRVVRLTLKKARRKIVSAHCRLGKVTRRFSTRKKKGRVLSQRPKAGKTLPDGAKVRLVVGKGPRRR